MEASDFARLVPPNKKLAKNWINSLSQRGETTAYRGIDLDYIGMPISGICAGILYLGGEQRRIVQDTAIEAYSLSTTEAK